MKENEIKKIIFKKIFYWEIKKIFLWSIKYLLVFALIGFFLVFFIKNFFVILEEQKTLSLLELFQEKKEVIFKYLNEVLETIFWEIPKNLLLLIIIFGIGGLYFFFSLKKNFVIIKNKIKFLKNYLLEEKAMKKNIFLSFIITISLLTGGIFLLNYGVRLKRNKSFSLFSSPSPLSQPFLEKSLEKTETPESQEIVQGLGLEIISPTNNLRVSQPQITIQGKTSVGAEIFINEKQTKADNQGNFSAVIALDEGENLVVITANDEEGNWVEKTLTLTYEPEGE